MVIEVSHLLIGIVSTLFLLSLIIGVQVFLTLNQIRSTLTKANRAIDDAQEVLEDISLPLRNLSATLTTLQTGGKFLNHLFADKKKRQVTKEIASQGRVLLGKLEEYAEHAEFGGEEKMYEGEDKIRSVAPTSSFLSVGKRLFKGIPKRR